MPQIVPISVGLPPKLATSVSVLVFSFSTTQNTTFISYDVLTENGESLDSGNIELTEEQFSHITDGVYVEDIALEYLGVERL